MCFIWKNRVLGIKNLAIKGLESYLTGRKQFVKLGTHESSTVTIGHGVPQESVLDLFFPSYIFSVASIFYNFNPTHHQYADDIQILIKISLYNFSNSFIPLTEFFSCWKIVFTNKLQLYNLKTEIIKIDIPQQVKFSPLSSINFGFTLFYLEFCLSSQLKK